MSKRDITVLTDLNLITCIVQKGAADDFSKGSSARGCTGRHDTLR